MITRKDYMNNRTNENAAEKHREYYSQFVNEDVMARICAVIGLSLLLASTDDHLNDIPMDKWDKLTGFEFRGSAMVKSPKDISPIDYLLLKEAGESVSSATLVCIYKEAAKQIISSHRKR